MKLTGKGGETVFRWESNVGFVTPATLLMTSYVFFEKSLKNLCYSFTKGKQGYQIAIGDPFKVDRWKKESIIDAQLRYLREKCEFDFVLAKSEMLMLIVTGNW